MNRRSVSSLRFARRAGLRQLALLAAALLACAATPALARDQIRIVGSSTVFPFATAVAEKFGQDGGFKTPVVESTGTGGGIKLFCAGVGVEHPDIANASRRSRTAEIETCEQERRHRDHRGEDRL